MPLFNEKAPEAQEQKERKEDEADHPEAAIIVTPTSTTTPPAPAQISDKQRKFAALGCFLGVLCLSPDALIVRLLDEETSIWSAIMFRNLFSSGTILLLLLLKHGPHGTMEIFQNTGWYGLLLGLFFALTMLSWMGGMYFTAAATAQVLFSSNPIFAAILGYFILQNRITIKLLITICSASVGIVVVFIGSLTEHNVTADENDGLTSDFGANSTNSTNSNSSFPALLTDLATSDFSSGSLSKPVLGKKYMNI